MCMSQEAYATKILERFGLSNSRPHATPAVADHEELWFDDTQPKVDQSEYRSMVGSLMYLMTCTRPDIAHTVQRLSRHLHDPREPHLVGAKRLLRYIKGSMSQGITFTPNSPVLVGYCDASWASKPDRRSTTGLICLIGGGVVTWKSARQKTVALSTCESEYIALVELAKELLWLCGLLQELGSVQGTVKTYCDNTAAIATAETTAISERSKHIEVRHHWIRQVIAAGRLSVHHVGTADQLADALTKIPTRHSIDKFKNEVMG
ncbi:hypothetical protein AaE_000373, partial [Aphanomyces astaci]